MRILLFAGLLLLGGPAGCASRPTTPPALEPQYPSPMVEHTRQHERIEPPPSIPSSFTLDDVLEKPVEVFIERDEQNPKTPTHLLIHFHGASFIPVVAIQKAPETYVLAVVNLGSGSSVYERPFDDERTFESLIAQVRDEVAQHTGRPPAFATITLSAFSAGYGAVRAILRQENDAAQVDAVFLLDGLHTDYVPARMVLADGGRLNTDKLAPFLDLARAAVRGEKRFVMTHSEIFPGTYASTTETADYLIQALGLRRTPVLRWGPGGMQQLSEAHAGRFVVHGFAGNTAPDHVDHLHALPSLLVERGQ